MELSHKYQQFNEWNKKNEKRDWNRLSLKKISDNLTCPEIKEASEIKTEKLVIYLVLRENVENGDLDRFI